MMKLIVLILAVASTGHAKIFGRCELTNLLRNMGMPGQLSTWVCIAYFESHFNTNAYNGQSGDHGLFQISEIYWCSTSGTPGKVCNARCSDFRDDNISNDVECVKKIYAEHQRLFGSGYQAWTVHGPYCSGDTSSWIAGC